MSVANDVEPSSAGSRVIQRTPDTGASLGYKIVRRLAKYSYVVSTLYHILRQRDTSSRLVDLFRPGSPEWEDASDALGGIVDLCRDSGVKLIVFLYGDRKTDFSKAFYKTYGDYLRDRGVAVHSFNKQIYERQYRNSIVDGHPNSAAHRLMADDVLDALGLSR